MRFLSLYFITMGLHVQFKVMTCKAKRKCVGGDFIFHPNKYKTKKIIVPKSPESGSIDSTQPNWLHWAGFDSSWKISHSKLAYAFIIKRCIKVRVCNYEIILRTTTTYV